MRYDFGLSSITLYRRSHILELFKFIQLSKSWNGSSQDKIKRSKVQKLVDEITRNSVVFVLREWFCIKNHSEIAFSYQNVINISFYTLYISYSILKGKGLQKVIKKGIVTLGSFKPQKKNITSLYVPQEFVLFLGLILNFVKSYKVFYHTLWKNISWKCKSKTRLFFLFVCRSSMGNKKDWKASKSSVLSELAQEVHKVQRSRKLASLLPLHEPCYGFGQGESFHS